MRTKSRSRKKRDAIPHDSRQAELRERSLAVAALSRREHLSLRDAAKIEGIRPTTVLRYAGSAFEKHGKDYRAKKTDRIPRKVVVLDSKGKRPITVQTARAASQIARYWNAVKKAQRTGNYSALKEFRNKRVPYGGFNFVTSPAKLKRLADAGILEFERLYWRGNVI